MDWFLYDRGLRHEKLNCIPHNTLIIKSRAKLRAYGFDRKSLIIISAYRKSRKEKNRTGSAFNAHLNILLGVH